MSKKNRVENRVEQPVESDILLDDGVTQSLTLPSEPEVKSKSKDQVAKELLEEAITRYAPANQRDVIKASYFERYDRGEGSAS